MESSPSDIPTPDEDGIYTCDICHMKVRVGCGGLKNFMQHRKSPVCMKAAGKASKTTYAAKKVNTLQLYFPKTTKGGPTKGQTLSNGVSTAVLNATPGLGRSANGIQSQATPPPTSTLTSSLVLHPPALGLPDGPSAQGSRSTHNGPGTTQLKRPDAHALMLLKSITNAARELPSLIPEAEEHDDIVLVAWAGAPEDASEAWEHLDHLLNWLLGYGIEIEDIAQRVHRGPLGVEGLARYIHGFVVDYGVTGDLLEGKLGRLLKAIELVKQ